MLIDHFSPIRRTTHRTPPKYRRIAVKLAKGYPLAEVGYLFGVSGAAVQKWVEDDKRYNPNS